MSEAKHQLAAIMFTDIVGYTALMGKDSQKALELVQISKVIQKPLVEKHNRKSWKADKDYQGTANNISLAHLLKNQKEQSIIWLERAIDLGWLRTDISKDAFFESLKDHPRFQELVEKQNKKREEVMALVATYNFPEPEDL